MGDMKHVPKARITVITTRSSKFLVVIEEKGKDIRRIVVGSPEWTRENVGEEHLPRIMAILRSKVNKLADEYILGKRKIGYKEA